MELALAYSLGEKAVLPVEAVGSPAAEEIPEVGDAEVVLEVTEILSMAAAPMTNNVMSRPVVRHTPIKLRSTPKNPDDCRLASES